MEGRTALGKLRRFGAIFRRGVFAGSPPTFERRLIALSTVRWRAVRDNPAVDWLVPHWFDDSLRGRTLNLIKVKKADPCRL